MQSAWLLSLALIAVSVVDALSLHQRDAPAVFGLKIERRRISPGLLQRRASIVDVPFQFQPVLEEVYVLNLTLGTPPQRLQVILDTGSSDFSVIAAHSQFCQYNPLCISLGTYNANASSTYKFVNHEFNITYPYDEPASGDFTTDELVISGITLPNVEFGIGYNTYSLNRLGLGYRSDESSDQYANFPEILVNSGLINSIAYSMWVDSSVAGTGTILFGGVNTAQYTGELHTLSIPSVDGYSSSDLAEYFILDSRLWYTYLPNPIALGVYTALGGFFNDEIGDGHVPCSVGEQNNNLSFTFTNFDITVPVSDLVLSLGDGGPNCAFGIMPSARGEAILGDNFLRNAYVVYDLFNNEISLAQKRLNPGPDNILEILNTTNAALAAITVSVATSAPIPTTVLKDVKLTMTGDIWGWNPTGTNQQLFPSTTSSKAIAALPTSNPRGMIVGLAGAALLIAM